MSSIVIAGDTSGSVTLQAPAVAGTTTLTLPATSGTVLTTASGTAATATNLAGGSNGTIPYQSASGTTQMLAVGTAGQVLQTNGAGAPTWVAAGGGKVLQVVQGTASGATYTVSNTYATTNLFATITPTSNTSTIIVIATSGQCYIQPSGLKVRLYRGTSGNGSGSSIVDNWGFGDGIQGNTLGATLNWLDSPASTSALTYTAMQISSNGSTLVGFVSGGSASMLLLEIGA